MADSEPDLRGLMERANQQLHQVHEIQRRLQDVRGEAQACDGRVQVQVGPSGALLDLQIDARAMRLPSNKLSEGILAACEEATRQAAASISEIVSELGQGLDSEAFGNLATGDFEAISVPSPDDGDPVDAAKETLRRLSDY